jgi:hypothetical protein
VRLLAGVGRPGQQAPSGAAGEQAWTRNLWTAITGFTNLPRCGDLARRAEVTRDESRPDTLCFRLAVRELVSTEA